jgi:hypothetical protein
MKIVHLKLINGDDIIAKQIADNEREMTIINPLVIDEREDEYAGKSMILLTKYVHAEQITINKMHIIIIADLPQSFVDFYNTSVEYNKKFIEPNVEEQVNKAVDMMQNIIHNRIDKIKFALIQANNNTYH